MRERGISLPLLIRFSEILKARVVELNEAFAARSPSTATRASYRGVYPIKVNQDRYVVEQLVEFGRPYHYGLEAGSKPELLAVMAMLEDEEALIICNGYKDEEYIETALLASKLGRTVILVVEKPSELPLIAEIVAERMGVRPRIGIRVAAVRHAAPATGRPRAATARSSASPARELLEAVAFLRENDLLDTLRAAALPPRQPDLGDPLGQERAARGGAVLRRTWSRWARRCRYLDVGGGLGVDYDGSQTNFASSMNYTLQEYANDIVFGIMEVCDAARRAAPDDRLRVRPRRRRPPRGAGDRRAGVTEFDVGKLPRKPPADAAPSLRNLFETYREVSRKNLLEAYHDALAYKDECLSLFNLGHLSLEHRVLAEDLFWAICQKILRIARALREVPEELEGLERRSSDTYFCNFSVFQSLPDSWAIDQLFPIVPIHRLDEEPTRRAVLADITCDSDGKIDHFIDRRDVKDVLELHPLNGERLLPRHLPGRRVPGDPGRPAQPVRRHQHRARLARRRTAATRSSTWSRGDTVTDVLRYVRYNREDLVARVRRSAEIGAARQAHDPRGVAAAAAPLRGRAVGLHLPGAGLTAWSERSAR